MTVTELFAELSRLGVLVSADGTDLTVRAVKGVLTPSLRTALVEQKAEILARLRQGGGDDHETRPLIVPAPLQARYEPFPLTDMQEAYWIGCTGVFGLGPVAYQVYYELEFASLDVPRLNRAWQRLVERHDMLRAIVRPDGLQQILAVVPAYAIEVLDLTGRPPAVIASELERIRQEMSHRVTGLDEWPLFEILATRLDRDRTRLHFRIGMTVADAWSIFFLFQTWFQLYLDPDRPSDPLEVSFRDFVLAEIAMRNADAYRRAEQYWLARLDTLPPAPDLPIARDPTEVRQPRFVRRSWELDASKWQRLKARAARAGLTPSAVLCAAFADVLATWSKSPDFILNLTFFNRPHTHPQLKDLFGDFTSTILLEVHGSQQTFETRAQALQEQFQKDLQFREYSGVLVLRELHRAREGAILANAPIVFTSLLNIRGADESSTFSLGDVVYGISQTPQVWLDHQVFERAGRLSTTWDAVEALFPSGLLDDMFGAYCGLVERLTEDEASWHETTRSIVPPEQLRQREALNATAAVPEVLLHTLFEEQVARRPHHPAVMSRERTLSYEELFRRATLLGHRLRQVGPRRGTLVAVVLEKGWEQIVAVLGVLASGAAYLPIDPDLPPERVAYLLENGQVEFAVTSDRVNGRLHWPAGIRRLCVDDEEWATGRLERLEPMQTPEDLAYVLYTSGSTGQPKGVMIDHRGAVNTILDINRRFGVGPDDRVLALSSLSFDLSVYDTFGMLAAGGTLIMPDAGESRNPSHWSDLMRREQTTIWNSVPALLQMLVEYAAGRADVLPASLRLVMLSGDWIPVTLPGQLRALSKGAQLVGLGGPTETSIWTNFYPIEEVDPAWTSIPYGRPLTNHRLHVLNSALEPCPVWVPGEIYVGGAGLAHGYWRDDEKTQARFFTHPRTGERLYRSGDNGRFLPDGDIEFLGRDDFQVKIGGYRIELGEIESALAQHPAVRSTVVVAAGPQSHRRLVAYVMSGQSDTSDPGPQQLQDFHFPDLDGVLLDPVERLAFKRRDPGLRPRSEQATKVHLNRPPLDDAAIRAYTERRSCRTFAREAISFDRLSDFLSCLLRVDVDGGSSPKHRYGSAGGLYPVQTYLFIRPGRVEGVRGGTYYYHPHDHSLVLLSRDAHIESRVHAPTNRRVFEGSAFSIYLVGQMNAIRPMYGDYSQHFATLEAGLITQVLEMSAPRCQIGLCQIGGLDFQGVRRYFDLDEGQVLLHSLVGGGIDSGETRLESLEQPASAVGTPPAEASLVTELRSYLRDKLPEHVVPSAFVLLDVLPLTRNGKVDRQALIAREGAFEQTQAMSVEPRTALERTLASVVQERLHLKQVSVDTSFFDLGADSVELVQLHRELCAALQRELPLREIFRYPTVAALAEYLESTAGAINPSGGVVSLPNVVTRPIDSRTPTLRRMEVEGLTLAVWEWPGEDPPLVFAHATGFHGRCWDEVVRRFPGRRCLAPDARGHGRSDRPAGPIHWKRLGSDLSNIAGELGLAGAIGIGHSMGGHSVASAAGLRPSAFAALLLIDPVILPPEVYGRRLADATFIRRRRERWSSPEEMLERFRAQPPFDRWEPDVLGDYCRFGLVASGSEWVLACPPDVEASIYEHSTDEDANLHPLLPSIVSPVTVIRCRLGNQPWLDTDWSTTDPRLASRFPRGVDVWLPESSHFLPMERPDTVADYIADLARR